jgi:hypothetical protein
VIIIGLRKELTEEELQKHKEYLERCKETYEWLSGRKKEEEN